MARISYVSFVIDKTPEVNWLFLVGTLGSAIFFVIAKTMTNYSMKNSLLSKIFPLSALGAVFTYLFGLILLSETIGL